MEAMRKTERIWLYITCFVLAISILLAFRAVQNIRRTNQTLQILKQMQPLIDKSLQLGQQINAEQWAVNEENKAIAAELAKPQEQRSADIEKRQTLLRQRSEGIQKLLDEQRQVFERIQAMQEKNGVSAETKAVLEKY